MKAENQYFYVILESSLFWNIIQRWLVITDVSGNLSVPSRSKFWMPRNVGNYNQHFVTSLKSEYLIYTAAEDWNNAQDRISDFYIWYCSDDNLPSFYNV